PNAELFTNAVTVNTAFDKRRVSIDVALGYEDDVTKAKHLIVETIRSLEGTLDDPPPEVLATELTPGGVTLRARWWIAPPLRRDLRLTTDRVVDALKEKLIAAGFAAPYPTYQIIVREDGTVPALQAARDPEERREPSPRSDR